MGHTTGADRARTDAVLSGCRRPCHYAFPVPASQNHRLPRVAAAAFAGAALVGLSGCSFLTEPPTPAPSLSATVPQASAEPAETPAVIALLPGAGATENLPFFAQTIAGVWASEQALEGRAYFDALAQAGFDTVAISRTSDTTAIGLAADTFSVAVAWHDGQCLIGQLGASTGEPVIAVAPQLANGACLIGAVLSAQ